MDLNGCVAFVTVVECGSFSEAARKLEIPRSTVSARVVALEAHLGMRLLRRTTRRVALTDDGAGYFGDLAPAIQALRVANERAMDSGDILTGSIRMSVPLDFPHPILSHAIVSFREAHPRVRFEILLDDSVRDFLAENIDLAIRGRQPGSDDFVAKKIATFRFGMFASPKYRQTSQNSESSPDLLRSDLAFVPGLNTTGSLHHTLMPLPGQDRYVAANSFSLLKQLAIDGAGTAILPVHICEDELRDGRLIEMRQTEPSSSTSDLFIVYPSRKDINGKVRAFTEHLMRLLDA